MKNGSPAGFAAGTLVHTRDGLRPIESIAAGDWVLAQGTPAQAPEYRQVSATTSYEPQPVYLLCVADAAQRPVSSLVVTDNQRVYVTGFDWGEISECYRSDKPDFVGWGRADQLPTNTLLQFREGATGRLSSGDKLWKTSQADMGWIPAGGFHCETGFLVELSNGEMLLESCESEFLGEASFDYRTETQESMDEWAARRPVYKLDVEGLHSFFVGECGLWVEDSSGLE